jgi:Co/Zn/Cd efflux system component
MKKTLFNITKMDCSSEEQLIRMKLESLANIQQLDFDIQNRNLTVFHSGDATAINEALQELNLNTSLVATSESEPTELPVQDHSAERKLLWYVLFINFGLFAVEIVAGFIADSMGLVADSLDMLADSLVYALSLYAVGRLATTKKRIAGISGYLQIVLALFGIIETVRRFLGFEDVPEFQVMIGISLLALIGNWLSLYLLQRSKSDEAHMQASMIFTSNDILVNIGVIVAGILVYFTNSKIPDLAVGAIVFLIVARGAFRILKLSK